MTDYNELIARAEAQGVLDDLEADLLAALKAVMAERDDAMRKYGATLHAKAATETDNAALRARVAELEYEINEASDPDFLFGAMDNVADMGVGLTEFAEAASRAIRAALRAKAKEAEE